MQSDKLKACPFCGLVPAVYEADQWGWTVECMAPDCDINPQTGSHKTETQALAQWNTRPVPAPKLDEDAVRVALERAAESFQRIAHGRDLHKGGVGDNFEQRGFALQEAKLILDALASPKADPKTPQGELLQLREWLRCFWLMTFDEKQTDEMRVLMMRANSPIMEAINEYFERHPWTDDDNTVANGDKREIFPTKADPKTFDEELCVKCGQPHESANGGNVCMPCWTKADPKTEGLTDETVDRLKEMWLPWIAKADAQKFLDLCAQAKRCNALEREVERLPLRQGNGKPWSYGDIVKVLGYRMNAISQALAKGQPAEKCKDCGGSGKVWPQISALPSGMGDVDTSRPCPRGCKPADGKE